MGRFVLFAMLAAGCARVTDGSIPSAPDASSSVPPAFQFHLVVHVFGGNGVEISASDGRASEHAFADFKFPDYASMPEAGILPLQANGVTLSINTRGCTGSDVVYEHVILSAFESLDAEAVYGSIAYDCTYPDGTTMTVPATKVAFLGPSGTPL